MKGYLVAYDLSDDRLRRRVSVRLARDGKRVQESVFEVYVKTDAHFLRLRQDLYKLSGANPEGHIRWYGLNQDSLALAGAIGFDAPTAPPAVLVL